MFIMNMWPDPFADSSKRLPFCDRLITLLYPCQHFIKTDNCITILDPPTTRDELREYIFICICNKSLKITNG